MWPFTANERHRGRSDEALLKVVTSLKSLWLLTSIKLTWSKYCFIWGCLLCSTKWFYLCGSAWNSVSPFKLRRFSACTLAPGMICFQWIFRSFVFNKTHFWRLLFKLNFFKRKPNNWPSRNTGVKVLVFLFIEKTIFYQSKILQMSCSVLNIRWISQRE